MKTSEKLLFGVAFMFIGALGARFVAPSEAVAMAQSPAPPLSSIPTHFENGRVYFLKELDDGAIEGWKCQTDAQDPNREFYDQCDVVFEHRFPR